MELEDLDPETSRELSLPEKSPGVVVESVDPGGAAEGAGFQEGDVILEVDRKLIRSVDGFFQVVRSKKSYLVRVRRIDQQGRENFSVFVLNLNEPPT